MKYDKTKVVFIDTEKDRHTAMATLVKSSEPGNG